MFRSLSLVMATASLVSAVFIAIAGARPHQLYTETWRAHVEAPSR
jgi:hypothetical protein